MHTPTTAWDRAPTDKELEGFWGKPAKTEARDNYFEVLTETVRKVPVKNLALSYISCRNNPYGAVEQYPVAEVISDYSDHGAPLEALLEVFAKSDCPLVAKWREEVAKKFADQNADEFEYFKSEE